MPVTRRGGGASSVLRSSSANLRPFTRRVALPPMGGAAPSSVMVFQPPQASHLPDHLDADAPQDWQTKLAEDLAMNSSLAQPSRGLSEPIDADAMGVGISLWNTVQR